MDKWQFPQRESAGNWGKSLAVRLTNELRLMVGAAT